MKLLAILGTAAVLICTLHASDKVQPNHTGAEPLTPRFRMEPRPSRWQR